MGTKTSPRRTAKRRASQEIVTAILDATCELIVARGVASTSTNLIAARAGVSVGSLYHYFPNKDAVLAAVTKRSNDQLTSAVRNALKDEGTLRQRYMAGVRAYFLADTLPLRAALIDYVPRGWESSGISDTEQAFEDIVRDFAAHAEPQGVDVNRVWMLTVAVRGAFQGSLRRRELIESGELLAFADDIVRAVLGD
ncbi:MAG: TetR/AcrR family transcriptional regulator [Myxococcota bacterium]